MRVMTVRVQTIILFFRAQGSRVEGLRVLGLGGFWVFGAAGGFWGCRVYKVYGFRVGCLALQSLEILSEGAEQFWECLLG